jgi:hypothetical protein
VTITIENQGSTSISGFSVSYRIDGGSVVTEVVGRTIAFNEKLQYTFAGKANLSTVGAAYTMDVWVSLASDENNSNDSLKGIAVQNVPTISSFPYLENFEAGTGYWNEGGTNSSWAYGKPAGTIIDTAASGSRAWVTNLTGNHNADEQSYVISPYFNLSGLSNPVIELNIWYRLDADWDGAALQYTIDNGATWEHLGAIADSLTASNWYRGTAWGLFDFGNSEAWTDTTTTWMLARHDLTAVKGETSVRFRIVFGSSLVNENEGFAFDDIHIGEDNEVPVVLSSFAVQAAGAGVTISWSTVSEYNNLGFNVLRSSSAAGPFVRINGALVLGAGSAAQLNNYSYADAGVTAGTWYYQLEMVGLNGQSEYSNVVAVTVSATGIGNEPQVIVPGTDIKSLVLYSMHGTVVPASQVKPGIYFTRQDGVWHKVLITK